MWSLIRDRKSKAIIVCPSSLVLNWKKEINKWLGTRLTPICVLSSEDSYGAVDSYRDTFKSPVMIIGYECFRSHINEIEKISSVNLLICDEAHRLKNSDGTQTMNALKRCTATKRLLLTGTPIQNNLKELFSIVDFACPGAFGNMTTFKRNYINPLLKYTNSHANEYDINTGLRAKTSLCELLSTVFLRRSYTDVCLEGLPPRTDVVIVCGMTDIQSANYHFLGSSLTTRGIFQSSSILGDLQKMRMLCNSFTPAPITLDFSSRDNNHRGSLSALLHQSAKLQILEVLLAEVRHTNEKEKIVIVSNFTSMLNLVEQLAELKRWTHLRLDGSTPSDCRQGLVNRFNSTSDDCFLFLLSAKAGGVGLNLIGGSRLVMLDCDWNPATDNQAMARVWRDGQRNHVFIYRFVTNRSIEAAILKRQTEKSDLSMSVLIPGVVREATQPVSEIALKLESLQDLSDLIYPPNPISEIIQIRNTDINAALWTKKNKYDLTKDRESGCSQENMQDDAELLPMQDIFSDSEVLEDRSLMSSLWNHFISGDSVVAIRKSDAKSWFNS